MLMPKKNDQFIKELLKSPEGLMLDFKLHISNPEKLAKTLTAFANTEGGSIVIGVSDKKDLVGIDPEEEIFMVEKASTNYCSPPVPFDFEVFETDVSNGTEELKDIYILKINVGKSTNKHYFKDVTGKNILYKRIYDRTIPTTEQ